MIDIVCITATECGVAFEAFVVMVDAVALTVLSMTMLTLVVVGMLIVVNPELVG
jgi:hypothetical protein